MKNAQIACLLFAITFVSCQNSASKAMADMVSEWTNKTINIPKDEPFVSLLDTVDVDFNSYSYKIITYTDASGCIGCQLKLNEWKKFNKEILSYAKDKVIVLKIIAPHRASEVFFELKSTDYDYPVLIDLEDNFNKSNQIPDNKAFVLSF